MINTNLVENVIMVKREPTSINVDPELWKEVKKAAIDLGITATEFFEQALKEKLSKKK
jgi:Ribbon-helix-helix protein, copG family